MITLELEKPTINPLPYIIAPVLLCFDLLIVQMNTNGAPKASQNDQTLENYKNKLAGLSQRFMFRNPSISSNIDPNAPKSFTARDEKLNSLKAAYQSIMSNNSTKPSLS